MSLKSTLNKMLANQRPAKKKRGRDYQLRPHHSTKATAIAMPKRGDSAPPVAFEVTADEAEALRAYAHGKTLTASNKGKVLEILEQRGKVQFEGFVFAPQQSTRYDYSADLTAEREALEEKEKAARDAGDVTKETGSTSIRFSDKNAKPDGRKPGMSDDGADQKGAPQS